MRLGGHGWRGRYVSWTALAGQVWLVRSGFPDASGSAVGVRMVRGVCLAPLVLSEATAELLCSADLRGRNTFAADWASETLIPQTRRPLDYLYEGDTK